MQLERVQQTETWDCGVSCLAAALPFLLQAGARVETAAGAGRDDGATLLGLEALKGMLKTRHVWTIDLCTVLRTLGVRHTLYTTAPCVRPEYAQMPFYRDGFEADVRRVGALFAEAAEAVAAAADVHCDSAIEPTAGTAAKSDIKRHMRVETRYDTADISGGPVMTREWPEIALADMQCASFRLPTAQWRGSVQIV